MSNLEYFSFSKLEKFDQCPYLYKLKYVQKHYSSTSSLAMEIGTIAHKCKELIGLDLIAGRKPDYEWIKDVFYNGCDTDEDDVKSSEHHVEHILGALELKEKYPFDWVEADSKSGLTYDEKVTIFIEHLPDMENDLRWKPYAVELPFEFVFDDKYLIKGYIDKVDVDKDDNFRIVDYKTSKATFDEQKVKTSMQMIIYDMAIRKIYGKQPIDHMFDFIFIGKTQHACSPGYFTRGEKKLRKWFKDIEICKESGIYEPKPTPLCHWCDFCSTNGNADSSMKFLCPYHSLWTPSNKTFEVAQKYNVNSDETVKKNKIDFWF